MSDGKTPYERRFGQPFKGPIIPFGSLFEYYPITAKDQSRIHQFGKKVLPSLFLGYALYAGGIWMGDVLIEDLEEVETMNASGVQRASTRRPVARTNRDGKNKKNEDTEPARRNPLHDLPEWSEEFTENLVDERVPEHTDAPASSSHKSALEPLRKMVSGKHCIKTHFAKDRNCDVCKKTKITRAPFAKKPKGAATTRAEKIWCFDYNRSQSA